MYWINLMDSYTVLNIVSATINVTILLWCIFRSIYRSDYYLLGFDNGVYSRCAKSARIRYVDKDNLVVAYVPKEEYEHEVDQVVA